MFDFNWSNNNKSFIFVIPSCVALQILINIQRFKKCLFFGGITWSSENGDWRISLFYSLVSDSLENVRSLNLQKCVGSSRCAETTQWHYTSAHTLILSVCSTPGGNLLRVFPLILIRSLMLQTIGRRAQSEKKPIRFHLEKAHVYAQMLFHKLGPSRFKGKSAAYIK